MKKEALTAPKPENTIKVNHSRNIWKDNWTNTNLIIHLQKQNVPLTPLEEDMKIKVKFLGSTSAPQPVFQPIKLNPYLAQTILPKNKL